jgi:phosphoribosylglycinamide formyltransferase-1
MTYSIAVFLSGSGTNLQALLDAQDAGQLGGAQISFVLSDKADAFGLQRALRRDIPAAFVPLPRMPDAAARAVARADWEQRILAVTRPFAPDLIVLSGFLRVLSADFLASSPAPMINQHPALLPEHGDMLITDAGHEIPALRGLHVVAAALRRRLPVTGCTVHRVTPMVDAGPLLGRAEVPILPDDDEASLHERIKVAERRTIVEVVARLAREHGAESV